MYDNILLFLDDNFICQSFVYISIVSTLLIITSAIRRHTYTQAQIMYIVLLQFVRKITLKT
jgi:hypothetical protein